MRVEFTLRAFPASVPLRDACALPVSCVVQPAEGVSGSSALAAAAAGAPGAAGLLSSLGRCRHCYAYVNHLCDLDADDGGASFDCSVCGRSVAFGALTPAHARYAGAFAAAAAAAAAAAGGGGGGGGDGGGGFAPKNSSGSAAVVTGARARLPELSRAVYEAVVDDGDDGGSGVFGSADPAAAAGLLPPLLQLQQRLPPAVPVTLVLVDVAGPPDFWAVARAGVQAAADALHPDALLGVVAVSDCIGLLDIAGPCGPLLHRVPILDPEDPEPLAPLEDVVPLACLLAPARLARQRLGRALELLAPEQPALPLPPHHHQQQQHGGGGGGSVNLQQPGMQRGAAAAAANGASGGAAAAAAAAAGPSAAGPAAAAGAATWGMAPPCRAVGPAVRAVLEYLRGLDAAAARLTGHPAAVGVAQLLLLLSGPPDTGPGRTVAPAPPGSSGRSGGGGGGALAGSATIGPDSGDVARQVAEMRVGGGSGGPALFLPAADAGAARAFYEQAAAAAATLGVAVDVFAAAAAAGGGGGHRGGGAGGGFLGLGALAALVNGTGGALHLYPSVEEATLPQDVHRRLSAPRALLGLLRVRASPPARVARCYGRLFAEGGGGGGGSGSGSGAQLRDECPLFQLPAVDGGQAVAFDLEHAGGRACGAQQQHVTVQVAFQYSVVVPRGSGGGGVQAAAAGKHGSSGSLALLPHAPGGGGGGFVIERRLRVCTLRLPVARDPAELYRRADADAVLALLTHKISRAAHDLSVGEARLLLRDWLVAFSANHHRNCYPRASNEQLAQLPVELSFPSSPALQPLPRLVYALLRSPLLSAAAQQHGDLAAFLQHLWTCLPPRELARAVYPALSAYADLDTVIAGGLALSRGSLRGAPLAEAAAAVARGATAAAAAAAASGAGTPAAVEAAAQAQAALALAADVAEGRTKARVLLLDAFILLLVVYCDDDEGDGDDNDTAAAAAAAAAAAGAGDAGDAGAGAVADGERAAGDAAPTPAHAPLPPLPFPPPPDSRLWRAIGATRAGRRVTAHVEVLRARDARKSSGSSGGGGGAAAAVELFHSLLIEDPDDEPAAGGGASGKQQQQQQQQQQEPPPATGIAPFLAHVKAEVSTRLARRR